MDCLQHTNNLPISTAPQHCPQQPFGSVHLESQPCRAFRRAFSGAFSGASSVGLCIHTLLFLGQLPLQAQPVQVQAEQTQPRHTQLTLGQAPPSSTPARDVQLKIGVVQRFGTRPQDTLSIRALPGDALVLRFQTGNQIQTVRATSLMVDVVMQPLPEAAIEERVIFGTYRSFESAEDTANQWRSQGIAVELAQPDRWQVWASREVYNTPLLRRLLMQSLQSQGNRTVRLETRVNPSVPKASIVVNGFRYTRDVVDIAAGKQVIQVDQRTDERVQRLYPGNLRLQPNAYGTYTLVNIVPLEAYLRGVVPHEIGLAAPPAAIEAQAVLARTYVLRNLRRFAIDNYELCADTQCQVYWGLQGADPKSDRAIAATRGLVLTFRNELVDALYSSTTGGVTAPFNDVWNGPPRPYLRAVIDAVNPIWDLANRPLSDEANFRAFIKLRQGFNEVGWERFRWQVTGYLPDMNAFLKRYLRSIGSPHANFTTIRQLRVTERAASGRVQRITVTTDQGTFDLHKDNILNAIYEPNSLLFHIDPLYGADKTLRGYVFTGGGFGHGVGLSQTGSYRLGELGWSSSRILSFYFPGSQLQPISPTIVFWRDPSTNQ